MFGMENNDNQFESRGPRRSYNNRGEGRPNRDWNSRERSFNRDRKPFGRNENSDSERPRFSKSYRNFDDSERPNRRRFNDEERPRRFNSENGERRPFRRFDDENRGFRRDRNDEERPRRSFDENRPRRRFDDSERPRFNSEYRERRPYQGEGDSFGGDRGFKPRHFSDRKPFRNKFQKNYEKPTEFTSIDKNLISRNFDDDWDEGEMVVMEGLPEETVIEPKRPATEAEGYRLNRFISTAGVCSRRSADDYIEAGRITLNGKVVTDFSTKVFPNDEVCLDGKKLTSQRRVYIVFNKPKNCISTKSDDMGRKTIFDYVRTDVEVKNVGRLDRDTTGVMLLTNDGDLIERLTHPRYNKMKIYHVFLNKNLSVPDMESIREGVDLEPSVADDGTEIKGGHIDVDDIQYVDNQKDQVGIQIHSGLYHVVRRIFEKYGYTVEKLDRVYFAGLTKKDLPRGHWRYLTQKEVAILKRGAYA